MWRHNANDAWLEEVPFALEALVNLYYPTDDCHHKQGQDLGYYKQREWKVVPNFAAKGQWQYPSVPDEEKALTVGRFIDSLLQEFRQPRFDFHGVPRHEARLSPIAFSIADRRWSRRRDARPRRRGARSRVVLEVRKGNDDSIGLSSCSDPQVGISTSHHGTIPASRPNSRKTSSARVNRP